MLLQKIQHQYTITRRKQIITIIMIMILMIIIVIIIIIINIALGAFIIIAVIIINSNIRDCAIPWHSVYPTHRHLPPPEDVNATARPSFPAKCTWRLRAPVTVGRQRVTSKKGILRMGIHQLSLSLWLVTHGIYRNRAAQLFVKVPSAE